MAHSPYPAAGIEPDAAQGHNRMAGAGHDPQNRSSQSLHISALGCPRYPKIIIASRVNRWFPQYLHIRRWEITLHGARRGRVCAREVLTRVIPEDHDGVKGQSMENIESSYFGAGRSSLAIVNYG